MLCAHIFLKPLLEVIQMAVLHQEFAPRKTRIAQTAHLDNAKVLGLKPTIPDAFRREANRHRMPVSVNGCKGTTAAKGYRTLCVPFHLHRFDFQRQSSLFEINCVELLWR